MLGLKLGVGAARPNASDPLSLFLKSSTFWLDVRNVSTLTQGGGTISAISDLSRNNNSFSEAGSSKFPTYNAANDTMDFDGSNDSLESFLVESPSIASAQTLPDGSGADTGKGFSATGMAYDASSDTFWVGNDGRGPSTDTTHEPSIINLSKDGTTIISEIDVHTIEPTATTVQGVTLDTSDNSLWFALPEQNLVINCTKAGVEQSRTTSTDVNGLAYDPINDMLYILRASGTFRRIRQDGTTHESYGTLSGSNWDHIYYDQAKDGIWITEGENRSDGSLYFFDIVNEKLSDPMVLQGADAIEGLYLDGGTLTIANNGYFHNGTPAINRLLTFNIDPNDILKTIKNRTAIDFICTVRMNANNSSADAILSSGNPLNEEGFGFYIVDSTTVRCFLHDGSNSRYTDVTVDDMNTLSILNFIVDIAAETFTVYQNNTLKGTSTFNGSLGNGIIWTRMQLADTPDARNAAIDIKAAILRDEIMTADERTLVFDYLNAS